ncbi:MAG: pyrroline-5-carboxylate reductase [Sphingomonadales bacterium]
MTVAISRERPLLLLGCGNMGAAMLKGWLAGGVDAAAIHVVDPAGPERAVEAGLDPAQITAELPADCRPAIMVLAIKPQLFDAVLPALAPALVGGDCVVLSVAAGRTLGGMRALLADAGGVVRAMPNTPAAIGQAMTVLCAEAIVGAESRALCGDLLSAIGQVRWVEDEDLMDAVTAVSGSGPAYVFYLIECLAAAGEVQGLAPDLATDLAIETVAGAAALARQSNVGARDLRRQVTSPGGTTQAGLEVLMGEGGLANLMRHTVAAAAKRAREMRD